MSVTIRAARPTRSVKTRLILVLGVIAPLVLLAWSASRYADAASRADAAHARLSLIRSTASDLAALQQRQSTASLGKRPERNLSGQVTDALADAGLPPTTLASLSPEEDAPFIASTSAANMPRGGSATSTGAAPSYRRQAARLTLEPLTLPDLGRYLAAWRTRQPEWTTTSIQISPLATKDAASTSPTQPIRVTCLIECVYVDQPESPRTPVNEPTP